ncbi:hydantoinase/oxoprolinase family protein [Elioraea sp. Yellowstone]|jgi:N-methylhydantoinase A|uniref:hydantoinase/oxoprolinase family protein n=1 Tax=Elioraea sp. Yellowstone TaxID=2592070 RepID=UPI001154DEF8|nr:hydantoinase/oxoprolinase family protein [Elioraea sp. Yellowstone]TQF79040.1 hydantoinase/oxoprolinase family protein [Elioraea sp. Yellowstone]
MSWRIGIDVGGTFTDLVAVDDAGRIVHTKAASTPADQSIGVMDGLALLAEALGIGMAAMLADTERIVHGTTVATNALLERKGARVGLLSTEGHIDILEMREGLKDDRYNLRLPPPEPLVPRDLRLGVAERIRCDGRVETALDTASLARAIGTLKARGVEAVAICYLHSYRDPTHERMTAEAVRAAMPDCYVSISSEVLPQIKEYERTCTTVVNAYVGPALERYLRRLEARLREVGYAGPLLIIQSHGGVATVADAVRLAAGAVLSGPAGGVAGSRHVARLIGHGDLIPFDMGGTSTDISLISGGEAAIASDRRFAGQRVGLQSLDIVSIGAGGGSIARVDAGGVLHVGPESAGAMPGPACYGRGGTAATVTDANLVLGYLDAENFLGGRARLDTRAAQAAVDRIAAALGVDRMTAAEGIHRVVNTRMAEGVRLVSVRRGIDPRRFALLSFGGAAGLHVTEIARQLDLTRVVVPRLAAVLSAWGMLATDLRYELARTHVGDASTLAAEDILRLYGEMEEEGRARLAAARFEGPVQVRRSADMRYGEQIFEIPVELDGLDWSAPDLVARMAEAFHAHHEALYTYALRDQEAVLVNARVAVIGALPSLPAEPPRAPAGAAPPRGHRRIHLGAWQDVPVFALEDLAAGQVLHGPAVVESSTTTVLLRAGDRAEVTPLGWLDIAVARRGEAAHAA